MGETEEMVDNYKYWRGGVFGGAMSNWFVSFEEFCEEFVFWGGLSTSGQNIGTDLLWRNSAANLIFFNIFERSTLGEY